MDLTRVYESMNEQERFIMTMDTMRPGFIAIPAWEQQIAYGRYLDYASEIQTDVEDIKPSELNRVRWLPESVDKYVDAAAKAQAIETVLAEQHDCLEYRADFEFLLRRELGLHSWDVESNRSVFSADLAGDIPVVTVDYAEDGKTIARVSLYGNEVDLGHGRVKAELDREDQQQEQRKKQEAAEKIEKPTGKQLAKARHLAEDNGVELPWLASKKEASEFIDRYTTPVLKSDRPTPRQLLAVKAIAEDRCIKPPFFQTKKEASDFIRQYVKESDTPTAGKSEKVVDKIKRAQGMAALPSQNNNPRDPMR